MVSIPSAFNVGSVLLAGMRHLRHAACRADARSSLRADPEVDDVAVLHDVVAALEAQRAVRLAVREGARLDERLERHDLGPYEVLLEVRVDRGGRLHGVRSLRDGPRAGLA